MTSPARPDLTPSGPAPAASCAAGSCGVPMSAMAGMVSLLLRLSLGGLLVLSGTMKLGLTKSIWFPGAGWVPTLTPLDFAFAISAFKTGLPEPAIALSAFVVPWMEVVAGAALVLGWWTRAAALLAAALMVVFTALVGSVLVRGLPVDCPCFGALKLFCDGTISLCHVARNSGFFAAAVAIAFLGPGWLAADRLLAPKRGCA